MQTPLKEFDSLGRIRRTSQGGAGPKHLPSKDAPKAGGFDPVPPDDLGDHGAAFWEEAVSNLMEMGFIDKADRMYLVRTARCFQKLCAYDRRVALDGEVVCDPHGNEKGHPLMNTVMKLEHVFDTRMSSLGLTPSARAKFGGNVKEEDPFAELLKAQRGN